MTEPVKANPMESIIGQREDRDKAGDVACSEDISELEIVFDATHVSYAMDLSCYTGTATDASITT